MGIRNKHLLKRFGLLFAVGALLISSFSILLPDSASAKKNSEMTIYEDAASATYYAALSWCMTYEMQSPIKASIEGSGTVTPIKNWFAGATYDNKQIKTYNPSSKSIVNNQDCDTVTKNALQLWGWSNTDSFLRDVGYTYNSEKREWTHQWEVTSGGKRPTPFWKAVQSKVYDGKEFNIKLEGSNNWGAPMRLESEYILLSSFFGTPCKGKNLGLFSSITDTTVKNLVNTGGTTEDSGATTKYLKTTWFDTASNTIGEYGIRYLSSVNSYHIYGNKVQMGCTPIIERMAALSMSIGIHVGGEACRTAGVLDIYPNYKEGNVITGCGDGFIHKSDITYCSTSFGSGNSNNADVNERRLACYFGQGNEAGEPCVLKGFTTSSLFNACIDGSKNKTEGYCTTKYTMASPGSGQTYVREAEKEACEYGQTVPISAIEIKPLQGVGAPQCGADNAATGCEIVETSCAVAGIGWMVCPVINFLATVGDSAYQVLANDFLRTNVGLVTANEDNGTYVAWGIIRSVANVVFVIVFLIIIFSQLTGAGVSNYGVKKMLPRLVIGVILVNVSFIVCQLAVDISNILGGSIGSVFDGIATTVNSSYNRDDPIGSVSGDGDTLLGMFGTILSVAVVGVGGYFLLSAGGTLLVAALLGLLVTLLILVVRQVIIVLAIVIAPLAFVAWILPNTENLFKQWLKLFAGMLALFPLVALIFGGATLASAVIGRIATDNDDMLWQLIAALLPAVSLLAVIPAIQGALKAVPGLGNLAGKLASKANGNLGKKARESYEGSTVGRGRAIRKQARANFRARKFAEKVEKGGVAAFMAGGLSNLGWTEGQRAEKEAIERAASGTAAAAQSEAVKQEMKVLEAKIQSTAADDIAKYIRSNHSTMNATEVEAATELLLGAEGTSQLRELANDTNIMQRHAFSITQSARRHDGVVRKKAPDLANWFASTQAPTGVAYTNQTAEATYKTAQASKLLTLDAPSAKIAEQHIDPNEALIALRDGTASQLNMEVRQVLERRAKLVQPPAKNA